MRKHRNKSHTEVLALAPPDPQQREGRRRGTGDPAPGPRLAIPQGTHPALPARREREVLAPVRVHLAGRVN